VQPRRRKRGIARVVSAIAERRGGGRLANPCARRRRFRGPRAVQAEGCGSRFDPRARSACAPPAGGERPMPPTWSSATGDRVQPRRRERGIARVVSADAERRGGIPAIPRGRRRRLRAVATGGRIGRSPPAGARRLRVAASHLRLGSGGQARLRQGSGGQAGGRIGRREPPSRADPGSDRRPDRPLASHGRWYRHAPPGPRR
jgi:hypothetical protein